LYNNKAKYFKVSLGEKMDGSAALATREIMWAIPDSFKLAMYVLFFISTGIMFKGLFEKLSYISGKKGVSALTALKPGAGLVPALSELRWDNFLKTLFLQGKVPRDKKVGAFHALIYYGFLILWIATDLVAIHADTPFKIFQGPLYIVISFLADIAGIMVLIGLFLAFKRRYVERPKYLSATNPNRERFMYGTLANLVVVGYLIEGFRIMGTGMPAGEKLWAPIGYTLALSLQGLALSDGTQAILYQGLWFFHMAMTMIFIASIGYTKFSHFIFLPFASLITPARRGAILGAMDFENEEAETFGLGKLSELTMKNRLDTISCVECGRCTQACPAESAGKPLDPKLIITKLRDFAEGVKKSGEPDGDIWEKTLYTTNELDSCTTCGACMEECPANIEHVSLIMEAKRYKVLTLGEIPPAAGDAVNKIKVNGNPWGIAQDERFGWAEGVDVPIAETGKKVDYLYFVGCAGSHDDANKKVVVDTVKLFNAAGVDFAVIGKTEKCCGDPIRRIGDEYSYFEVAIDNIANINQYDFTKIVSHCPHCLHTIGKEYSQFEGGNFEVIHHSELLNELLKTGKLKPKKNIDEELTFHDPCYLGRHHGEYDAPRKVLEAIPGVKIKEMEKTKDTARCCGMGGGNMWYELPEGDHLALNRLEDIAEMNTEKLATGCSYCLINFNSSKGQNSKTENLGVEDIANILAKSVL
jgi:Fe-S oxidoreductase